METVYCVDERHGTPCPSGPGDPCAACQDECSGVLVSLSEAQEEFPDWE